MEDSQDSVVSIGKEKVEPKSENNSTITSDELALTQNQLLTEFEREIQTLERDIRQQKESSVNAKTAITFDQLKKINSIARFLGPHKEAFFDRICRAAEIQRASLKNRLKQNKDRFEPVNCLSSTPTLQIPTPIFDSQSSLSDSQAYILAPNLSSLLLLNNQNKDPNVAQQPPSRSFDIIMPPIAFEEEFKIPAERQFDLLELGFSFEELKQLIEMFDRFKHEYREIAKPFIPCLSQVMNQFSNFISVNSTDHLRLISVAFNLLELGNARKDVQRILVKERRKDAMDGDDEIKSKRSCLSPPNDRGNEQSRESTRSPIENLSRDDMTLRIGNNIPDSDQQMI